ncbi:MAG: hypothetical protein ABSG69_08355 [Candidatus Acidiferrum sp.]
MHEFLVLVLASVLTAYLCIRYWRAMLWSASQHRLSEATRELGAWIDDCQGEKSLATVCALLKLCPNLDRGGNRTLFAVRAYDRVLKVGQGILQSASGNAARWLAAERKACAYFAAVLLDRRITRTSEWYAGQITDPSV